MALSDTDTHHHRNRAPRRANIVLIGFLLIGGFYLVTEHRAHLFAILPFLFLPVCLLMPFFMHGHGHGHGDKHGGGTSADTAPSKASPMPPPSEGAL
jgi:hypothetical protein